MEMNQQDIKQVALYTSLKYNTNHDIFSNVFLGVEEWEIALMQTQLKETNMERFLPL